MCGTTAKCLYGILLGTLVGFLDGTIGVILWVKLGQPDFFIRPSWESIHVIVMTICGGMAGAIYGAFLCAIASPAKRELCYRCIFLIVMALAACVFSVSYYWSIKNQVSLFFAPPFFVFVVAVVVAKMLSRRDSRGEPNASARTRGDI